ncbi:hypothetical protein SLS57_012390 [Botryosphaeria dothidea]
MSVSHGAFSSGALPPKFESQGDQPRSLCEYCKGIPFREEDYADASKGRQFVAGWKERQDRLVYNSSESKEGIVIQFHLNYDRTDTFPDLPSITATAEAGCPFCEVLLTSYFMTKCARIPGATNVNLKLAYEWNRETSRLLGLSIAASITRRNGDTRYLTDPKFCCIESERDDPCTPWLGIKTKPQPEDLSLEETLEIAKGWVEGCVGTCHPQESNKKVPTRLVDLGAPHDEPSNIRVVHSGKAANSADWKYVALSHCWGDADCPPLRTTTDSLAAWLDNIPFATLPKNYQDAVVVTRSLGIRYLWIDSLCIIQDDVHDWDTESIQMNEVYHHAYVTLIAAAGSSCHDGFLRFQPARRVAVRYGPSTVSPSIAGTYHLREARGLGARDIEQSAWRTRGWTFQESLFSRRKLFFTAATAYYQCGFRLQALQHWATRRYRHGEHFRENLARVSQKAWSAVDFYGGTWYGRVQEYSGRRFTVAQDRLAAVAAWARELACASEGGRYLAGMWEDGLCYWLLWCCSKLAATQSLQARLRFAAEQEFVAPSWSWASQAHKVHWQWPLGLGGKRVYTVAEVLECKTAAKTKNTFGRLVSGYLRVRGAVCVPPELPLYRSDRGPFSFIENQAGLCIGLDWTEPRMAVSNGEGIPYALIEDLVMLRLVQTGHGSQYGGLMLLPTGKSEQFWRVGIFILDNEKESGSAELFKKDCEEKIITIV